MISINISFLSLSMLFDDKYRTIKAAAEGIYREKGSKFIAYAFPIKTEDEARQLIAKIKSDHPKARHHCTALRLTPDRNVYRVNDDGEPAGTAGRPILNTLLSKDLTNVIVIVVRYFGGTLLGVPRLINAYKSATADALDHAKITELSVTDVYSLSFDYLRMNDVMQIVKEAHLKINKQEFENDCEMEIEVPKSQLNNVLQKLDKVEGLKYRYLYTV